MLLCTFGVSLLENMLIGKGLLKDSYGNKEGKRMLRGSYESKGSLIKDLLIISFLIAPCSLTAFEIQKYYQIEPRFNGIYSRDNLPKTFRDRHVW